MSLSINNTTTSDRNNIGTSNSAFPCSSVDNCSDGTGIQLIDDTRRTSSQRLSLIQRVIDYDNWSKKRQGPPPLLPPVCIGLNYADTPPNQSDPQGLRMALACLVTLAALEKTEAEAPTCGLPARQKLEEMDGRPDSNLSNAKRAAADVETALAADNAEAAQAVWTTLRGIVERVEQDCFEV